MAAKPPRVSIIIPCRNEARNIEGIVRGLLVQDVPEGGVEIILADGMSNDGTREILRRMEDGRWKMEDGGQKSEVRGQRSEVSSPSTSPLRLDRGEGQGEVSTDPSAPTPQISAFCFLLSPLRRLLSAFTHHPSGGGGQSSDLQSSIPYLPAALPPLLRIIDNPGLIVSTGLNSAVRAATGNIIVRMDAHTEYAPDYVVRCVETLEQTGADNVGGPWVARGNGYVSDAIAAAFQSPFAVGGARGHNPEHEGPVDTVYLGCWRKESFDRFGYFDEELVRNQDDEHNLRISRGGGKIWQSPKIRSWYRPRGSLSALFKQYMQYGYWKVRVIQKHRLPASMRHLVPGAFVFTLLLLFLLSAFSSLASALTTGHKLQTSVLCPLSSGLLALALLAYALALITASLITAAKAGWRLLPVLPAVFACYHIGYGYGFLRGIGDFVLRRKASRKEFEVLTR